MTTKKSRPGAATPGRQTKKGTRGKTSASSQNKRNTWKCGFQAKSNADALAEEFSYLLERSMIPNRFKEDSPVYTRKLRYIRIELGIDE